MTKEEIKNEITNLLDKLSNNALEKLLAFLKQFEDKSNPASLNSNALQKILSEDQELLRKLAQ